jgi:hypothetical protein
MRHDGVFIVPTVTGYMITARKQTTTIAHFNAHPGVPGIPLSSYQFVTLSSSGSEPVAGWTMQSGNDVWWGGLSDASASNRWISWACDWTVLASCVNMTKGSFWNVAPYDLVIWADGTAAAFGGAGSGNIGCRHEVEAAESWTSAYCFG